MRLAMEVYLQQIIDDVDDNRFGIFEVAGHIQSESRKFVYKWWWNNKLNLNTVEK